MIGLAGVPYSVDTGSGKGMNTSETNTMNDMFTMFVLSMIVVSVLSVPVVVATGYANAWRHVLEQD
jgi:hypothetical protein